MGDFEPEYALKKLLSGSPLKSIKDKETGAFAVVLDPEAVTSKLSSGQSGGNPVTANTNPNKQMKKNTDESRLVKWLAGITTALMAVTPATTVAQEEDNDVLLLSPFVVESSEDVGYLANSTLAGTRIKSNLRDIGTSVQIVTQEFIGDTGVTNAEELLVYTTGTEVSGIGGNFANPNFTQREVNFDSLRRGSTQQTRVRGLAGATLTRNYFASSIPFDSYNTDRVAINRGANNILFGIGSPAGIINYSTVQALQNNENKVELRLGSFDSHRQVVDFNRVVLEDKLIVRLIGLNNYNGFQQDPAFEEDRRIFGHVLYKPFKNTSIRLNFESGNMDSSRPRIDPPRDRFTTWWTERNKTTRVIGEDWRDRTQQDVTGPPGNWIFDPGLVYNDPNSVNSTNFAFVPLNNFPNATNFQNAANPDRVNNYFGGFGTMRDTRRILEQRGDPLASFQVSEQITDTSIFDFRNKLLDGKSSFQYTDFTAVNIAFEQQFLDGDAGVELVLDNQDVTTGWYDSQQGFRGFSIGMDFNQGLPNGDPNPNFGRPYLASTASWNETEIEANTVRLTAFYQFDFEEKLESFLGKVLGRHVVTGLYNNSEEDQYFLGGVGATMEASYAEALGFANNGGRSGISERRELATVYYLGSSVLDLNSPSGANIGHITERPIIPDNIAVSYVDAQTREYTTSNFNVLHYDNTPKEGLATNATLSNTETESFAAVLQSHWFDGLLVSTLGWREDDYLLKNKIAPRNPDDSVIVTSDVFSLDPSANPSELSVKNETFSWGLVLHTPEFVKDFLPEGVDLSLHYSEAENFQPNSVSRNILGGFNEVPTGITEEMGITLSVLDGRLVTRLNWYETSQQNLLDTRLSNIIDWVFWRLPANVLQYNTAEAVNAAGFQLPPQVVQNAYEYNISANPDGTQTLNFTNINAQEVIDSVSEGFELELIYNITDNWRLLLNVAQQEAVRSGTAQTFGPIIDDLIDNWLTGSTADLAANPVGDPISLVAREAFTVGYSKALLEDGAKATELREWRMNVVTAYDFDNDSKFKGIGIGGALRWQDEVAIGSPVIEDPELGFINDIDNPIFGPDETKIDAWISYDRTLLDGKVDWTIQLNIRNLLDEDDLVPVRSQQIQDSEGNFIVGAWRIPAGRTWELTSTFRF